MSNTSRKKMGPKQIIAIIGVALLVSLYLVALILALIGTAQARQMLFVALIGTFVIPIVLYLIMMFYKLANPGNKQTIEVPVELPEDDASKTDAEAATEAEVSDADNN